MAQSIIITERELEFAGQITAIDKQIDTIEGNSNVLEMKLSSLRERIKQGKIMIQKQAEWGDREFQSRVEILKANGLFNFGIRTAYRYIAIAKAEELFNVDSPYLEYLPLGSYTALASIASMDEEAIKQAIADGRLTAKTTADEASALSSMSKGRVVKPSKSELQEMLEKEREVLKAQIREQVITEQQAQLQQAWDRVKASEQNLDEIKNQLDTKKTSLEAHENEIKKKERELDDIKQKLDQLIAEKVRAEIQKDKKRVEELEANIRTLKSECDKHGDIIESQQRSFAKKNKEYKDLVSKFGAEKEKNETLREEIKALRTGQHVEVVINKLADRIEKMTDKMDKFINELHKLLLDLQRARIRLTQSRETTVTEAFSTNIVRLNHLTYQAIEETDLGIKEESYYQNAMRIDPDSEAIRVLTHLSPIDDQDE